MSNPTSEVTVTSFELTELISRAVVKGAGPAGVLFIAATVQAFRHGFALRYVFLATCALLSVTLLISYAAVTKAGLESPLPRGWAPMLLTFGGFVPYLFGCYLFFYEGLWRLTALRNGWNGWVLVLAAGFVFGGFCLVSATHQVSELAKFRRVASSTETAV